MRYFAKKHNEDEEKWGIIGLVHDLDYEMFPNEHCTKTREILEQENWHPDWIDSIVSHAWGICSDVEPKCLMDKVLYATDELTGLITAAALVRPSKSVMDLPVSSVKKRWKDKRFAAGVNREVIESGAEMLHIELNDLIDETILGMREVAESIGLKN